ncbi:hypothetical protein [Floccifex sp.]|uniref:hypothetical protein n=1 Tax=Floccifex sp. TaxID=2815810 RepID=UPI003F123D64
MDCKKNQIQLTLIFSMFLFVLQIYQMGFITISMYSNFFTIIQYLFDIIILVSTILNVICICQLLLAILHIEKEKSIKASIILLMISFLLFFVSVLLRIGLFF